MNNVQMLHSKASGFSVVADADGGMAIQVNCVTGEDAAALAGILRRAKGCEAWNRAELEAQFAAMGAPAAVALARVGGAK